MMFFATDELEYTFCHDGRVSVTLGSGGVLSSTFEMDAFIVIVSQCSPSLSTSDISLLTGVIVITTSCARLGVLHSNQPIASLLLGQLNSVVPLAIVEPEAVLTVYLIFAPTSPIVTLAPFPRVPRT